MQSKYNYTATVRYLDIQKQVKAPSMRQLAILLGISEMTLRDLVYGSNRRSKIARRITVSREPK